VYHTTAIKQSKKGLNVYQTHCDLLQDPEFFCFAKGRFTMLKKKLKPRIQTTMIYCCKQNSIQNSSNYHDPEWGLNPVTCSMEKTYTNIQKNFDCTTISLMLREQHFAVHPQYRPQHRLCSCGAKV
jgi:hypothetical protein